jgi:hypothetical protein
MIICWMWGMRSRAKHWAPAKKVIYGSGGPHCDCGLRMPVQAEAKPAFASPQVEAGSRSVTPLLPPAGCKLLLQ